MAKDIRQYRCDTCGDLYQTSVHEYERADGMTVWIPDNPHRCSLPHGKFVLRTEKEYEWVNGKLMVREITYRKHNSYLSTADIVSSSEWVQDNKPWVKVTP